MSDDWIHSMRWFNVNFPTFLRRRSPAAADTSCLSPPPTSEQHRTPVADSPAWRKFYRGLGIYLILALAALGMQAYPLLPGADSIGASRTTADGNRDFTPPTQPRADRGDLPRKLEAVDGDPELHPVPSSAKSTGPVTETVDSSDEPPPPPAPVIAGMRSEIDPNVVRAMAHTRSGASLTVLKIPLDGELDFSIPELKPVAAPPIPIDSITVRAVPALRQIGRPLLLVAKVAAGESGVGDHVVEWTIDRAGTGQIIGVSSVTNPVGKQAEKILPTFGRTYSATESQTITVPGETDLQAEIGVGEAWCVVDSETAGDMRITAAAPAIQSTSSRQTSVRVHWVRARAEFPPDSRVRAGTVAAASVRVRDNATGDPLPDYRIRFSLLDAGGVDWPPGSPGVDVVSDADGLAVLRLHQSVYGSETTRIRADLLGRQTPLGFPAVVIGSKELSIEWQAPAIELSVHAPTLAAVGEPVPVLVAMKTEESALPDLRIVTHLPDSLRRVEQPADSDKKRDAPRDHARNHSLLVACDKPGPQTLTVEIHDGTHIAKREHVTIRFEQPKITIEKRFPERWMVGQRRETSITVKNQGKVAANGLHVVDEIPGGLEVIAVKARRSFSRLDWSVDRLDPGAQVTLTYSATPTMSASSVVVSSRVESANGVLAELTTPYRASGVVSLSLELSDRNDPVAVGTIVEYLIKVENSGTLEATDISFVGDVSSSVQFVDAYGTLPVQIREGRLELGPIPKLPAGAQMSCVLRAKLTMPGEARFAIILVHEAVGKSGLKDEESTRAFVP